MKNLRNIKGIEELNKAQQRTINGGGCEDFISADGTLCGCIGWVPQGNKCVPGTAP